MDDNVLQNMERQIEDMKKMLHRQQSINNHQWHMLHEMATTINTARIRLALKDADEPTEREMLQEEALRQYRAAGSEWRGKAAKDMPERISPDELAATLGPEYFDD